VLSWVVINRLHRQYNGPSVPVTGASPASPLCTFPFFHFQTPHPVTAFDRYSYKCPGGISPFRPKNHAKRKTTCRNNPLTPTPPTTTPQSSSNPKPGPTIAATTSSPTAPAAACSPSIPTPRSAPATPPNPTLKSSTPISAQPSAKNPSTSAPPPRSTISSPSSPACSSRTASPSAPPRRASVLAYISSLELRTLPAIDHELSLEQDETGPIFFGSPKPGSDATPTTADNRS
jgi:hypothetical protein